MADVPLTLRVVSRAFRSVLDADQGTPLHPWELIHRQAPLDLLAFPILPAPGAATSPARRRRTDQTATPTLDPRKPRRPAGTRTETLSPAAERVANAIVQAIDCPTDLRTLNAWGQRIGVSRGALRVWCTAANVSARSCLDFLRVLRAVVVSDREDWDLLRVLDVIDQRTLTQLLNRGGMKDVRRQRPSVRDFLTRQHFIQDPLLIAAVKRRLQDHL